MSVFRAVHLSQTNRCLASHRLGYGEEGEINTTPRHKLTRFRFSFSRRLLHFGGERGTGLSTFGKFIFLFATNCGNY